MLEQRKEELRVNLRRLLWRSQSPHDKKTINEPKGELRALLFFSLRTL